MPNLPNRILFDVAALSVHADIAAQLLDVDPSNKARNVAPDRMIAEHAVLHLVERRRLAPALIENAVERADHAGAIGAVLAMQKHGRVPASAAQVLQRGDHILAVNVPRVDANAHELEVEPVRQGLIGIEGAQADHAAHAMRGAEPLEAGGVRLRTAEDVLFHLMQVGRALERQRHRPFLGPRGFLRERFAEGQAHHSGYDRATRRHTTYSLTGWPA